jgi:hypothetical protein
MLGYLCRVAALYKTGSLLIQGTGGGREEYLLNPETPQEGRHINLLLKTTSGDRDQGPSASASAPVPLSVAGWTSSGIVGHMGAHL